MDTAHRTHSVTDLEAFDIPSDGDVAEVLRRLPLDPASRRAVELKYERRRGPGWTPIPLSEMIDRLGVFLRAELADDFEIIDADWMTGGASKVQMAFTLDWNARGRGHVRERLMLRMDPPETLNTTNKHTEAELNRVASETIPAPRVLWEDAEGETFPEPALIYTFASGVAAPTQSERGSVSGIGTGFGPELREVLAPQFVRHLAQLHTIDCHPLASQSVCVPRDGTQESAQARLNFERVAWEIDRGQDLPLMEVAADWMQRNLPTTDHPSIVHGDFRSGNFLFDEADGSITAWLDWELAHVGDRHEDLAYIVLPLFGGLAEDGQTFLASGLITPDDLFAQYEDVSGLSVDRDRVRWYSVLVTYSAIIRCLVTPFRVSRLGRSHQDVVLTQLQGAVPVLMRSLADQLKGAI